MSDVRKFPWPEHEKSGPGWCRWCGLEISAGQRKQHKRAYWHDHCRLDADLHTRADIQLIHLQARDGPGCKACGIHPFKWWRETLSHGRPNPWTDPATGVEYWFPHTRVIRVDAAHVDHAIPLWLVAHLPPDERRPYFGPGNLQILCERCHSEKTGREATQRGKANRQAAMHAPRAPSRMRARRLGSATLKRTVEGRVVKRP